MNELNKLIEQAFDDEVSAENMFGAMEILCGKEAFIERINEILASRPTCGQEQRKFLDEVEKFAVLHGKDSQFGLVYRGLNESGEARLYQNDYFCDLEKVIKGN